MASLLYIHGFLSSPASFKAVQLGQWLAAHKPHIRFLCPALPPYPDAARQQLEALVASAPRPLGLVGSSLGGYWASYLAERYDLRAVLVNPSVNPCAMLPAYFDQPLKNFHTDALYQLTAEHLPQLAAVDTPVINRPDNFWLLAQTGDETLDYRLAAQKYARCRHTIEAGGDHSFQGFERFFEPITDFLRL